MSSNLVTGMTEGLSLEVKTVLNLCEAVDSPRSLAVYLMLQNREFGQYCSLPLNPDNYDLPGDFADDYLVTEVLRKSPNLPLGLDRKDAAISSFYDSELLCAFTNKRVKDESNTFEHEVRKQISILLGPLNLSSLRKIEGMMKHGPGATASVRGRGSVLSDKFEKPISTTVDLYPYTKSIMGPLWHNYHQGTHDVVYGSKFTTVPKSAKTDRGICIEPTLNMFVQRGIGKYLRYRLKRFGIDLSTQQDKNRELASRAYDDGLATIDLSMASDSLAYQVVLSYFPAPWVDLLALPRCHRCFIDGEWHELEKWSSMGNGYTFELESLLFTAVCRAIIPPKDRDNMAIYGDDIIIPSIYALSVIDTLKFLGFNVNAKKSFLAGNFFESCGSDWFKGHNVRPFYLKGVEGTRIPYALLIANKLRIYSWARCDRMGSDRRFKSSWHELLHSIPRMWKKAKVPVSFGDSGLISSFAEAKPKRAGDQWDAWSVLHVKLQPVKRRKLNVFPYLASLARNGSDQTLFTKGREPRRGYLADPLLGKSTVQEWTDGLDWEILYS